MSATQDADDCPDYDVTVETTDLLADLAENAAYHARQHAKHARNWREDDWWQYRRWMLEESAAMQAYRTAIAMLQPGRHDVLVPSGEFTDDGTVRVREFMREISRLGDDAHERGSTQARKAARMYARIESVLRDDYGVGWPRLDDIGGTPLEEDLP